MSDSDSTVGPTKISKLEFNDPLYLHPSDTSSAPLITQKLKGTKNYNGWSCALKLALQTKNKLGFIDGSCANFEYEDDDVLLGQWDRCNSVVLTWILMSLSEDVYNGQIFSKTAESVWTEIKETYDKIDASVTFNLYQNINSCSQAGQPLSDYYHKLNAMWRQFDNMIKIDDIVSANKSFQEHNQFLKLMQFLMGLDDVYVPIRSQILTSDPVPNVKTAFSIISRDESHRLHSNNSVKNQSSAFVSDVMRVSKTSNTSNNNSGYNNKKKYRNPLLKCTNCNMLGHTVDRCFELIGYPPGYIKNPFNQGSPRFNSNNCATDKNGSSGSSVQLTSDQIMKLLSLVNEKPSSNHPDVNMSGWIIDSGANQHMVSSSQNLSNVVNDLLQKRLMGTASESDGLYFFDECVNGKTIITDNGTEFVNTKMKMFTRTKGIVHQTSCAYTPQQNGIAERKHRHLLNVARLPSSVLSGKYPYELIYGSCPNFSHLRSFGCLCFANVLNQTDKFSSRSLKCVFVGYSTSQKGYKLFDLENKCFIFSRDVKFYEHVYPFKTESVYKVNLDENSVNHLIFFDFTMFENDSEIVHESNIDKSTVLNQMDPISPNDEGRHSSTDDGRHATSYEGTSGGHNVVPEGTSNVDDTLEDTVNINAKNLRRTSRRTTLPKRLNDYVLDNKVKYGLKNYLTYSKLCSENFCFITYLNKSQEPKSYQEASKDKN
ncbi:uncharacterized protein [Rutidosis leptorrhynchoides]|uniref:uncharacterized protein n=1 Tax=Rutidosis leptorrhynchoides TaxID=125765 RepID=UPI003A996D26